MYSLKTLLAAAAAAFAVPASATVIHADVNTINYEAGNYYGGIGYAPANFAEIGPAGRFLFQGTNLDTNSPFSALTWCADIFHAVGTGDYLLSSLGILVSNTTKQAQLAALLANADAAINASGDRNATAAALQLAIWEVIYEAGTSGYTVASGDFYTYGDPSTNNYFVPLWGEANGYLANVTGGSWTGNAARVSVLFSETVQSQIYINAVPEPASWALLISGFGLAGVAMRRTRRRMAAA